MEPSPLLLDGWVEFNRLKWGLTPERLRLTAGESDLPALETVLYLNGRGQVVLPRLNPYLPLVFQSTPAKQASSHYHQWIRVVEPLLATLTRHGVRSVLKLPPHVADVRPWQWAGYHASVAYTFYLSFPHELESCANDLRRNLKKARQAGMRCERATDLTQVVACLRETEDRQGFRHPLDARDLEFARGLMGDDHFRAYLCYTPEGEVAGANIALHVPGGRALGWVMGTKRNFLHLGTAHVLLEHLVRDLQAAGATGLDMTGANLPGVAAAKAAWGGQLVPYYVLEPYGVRSLGRWLAGWSRFAQSSLPTRPSPAG